MPINLAHVPQSGLLSLAGARRSWALVSTGFVCLLLVLCQAMPHYTGTTGGLDCFDNFLSLVVGWHRVAHVHVF